MALFHHRMQVFMRGSSKTIILVTPFPLAISTYLELTTLAFWQDPLKLLHAMHCKRYSLM